MTQMTNCKNCGSPLVYGANEYESTAKCRYCGTEYHIDRLGRIEEYKVKIEVMGAIHEFYISEITLNNICHDDCYRNFDGCLTYKFSYMETQKMEMTLIEI